MPSDDWTARPSAHSDRHGTASRVEAEQRGRLGVKARQSRGSWRRSRSVLALGDERSGRGAGVRLAASQV